MKKRLIFILLCMTCLGVKAQDDHVTVRQCKRVVLTCRDANSRSDQKYELTIEWFRDSRNYDYRIFIYLNKDLITEFRENCTKTSEDEVNFHEDLWMNKIKFESTNSNDVFVYGSCTHEVLKSNHLLYVNVHGTWKTYQVITCDFYKEDSSTDYYNKTRVIDFYIPSYNSSDYNLLLTFIRRLMDLM